MPAAFDPSDDSAAIAVGAGAGAERLARESISIGWLVALAIRRAEHLADASEV